MGQEAALPPLPPPVAREFRAAWISPLSSGNGGDWPSAPGLSADSQKAELRALLDRAKAIGLNVVILHVRTAADALYKTSYAPWSAFLAGKSGRNPGYDPLAYAIREAHARGLQLHAWFNPFRAMLPNFAGHAAASHVTRKHPSWIRRYGKQRWIDPGIPAARKLVIATIVDVVKRYDVDGIHIDDYFYPYRETRTVTKWVHHHRVRIRKLIPFPDGRSWRRYGVRKGWHDRDDWRRHNINTFIHDMYRAVKTAKPWVVVGVSPFGIWRPGSPPGITGLDSYTEIYADSRYWLSKGWLDYLAPQLYWPLDGDEHRFTALDAWWHDHNPMGRYVWPGLATTREQQGWPENEVATQIATLRELDTAAGREDVPGHIHFRMQTLSDDGDLLGEQLRQSVYARTALVPSFPWLAHGAPAAPHVTASRSSTQEWALVTPGDSVPVRWWMVQREELDGRWTVSLHRATGSALQLRVRTAAGGGSATVRAIGRAGQAGPAISLGIACEGEGDNDGAGTVGRTG